MLSRVADAIYWMNRYIERAESVARFVDVTLYLSLDLPSEAQDAWSALIAVTGDEPYYRARYGEPTREGVLRFLTFDNEYPNSIVSCLRSARENARSVREVISSEMWEQINRTFLTVRGGDLARVLDDPSEFYAGVKQAAHLFVGITYLTMTHNEAWHFGRLGRMLERADKTSRIVDVKYFLLPHDDDELRSTVDELEWGALLKSASAFEMYRKRFGRITPANVIDFLLLDRKFPRAMRYCVTKGERSLRAIAGTPPDSGPRNVAEERMAALRTGIDRFDVSSLVATGVHETLDQIQSDLNAVGDGVFRVFFDG